MVEIVNNYQRYIRLLGLQILIKELILIVDPITTGIKIPA